MTAFDLVLTFAVRLLLPMWMLDFNSFDEVLRAVLEY